MMDILLILEDADNKNVYQFASSDDLEDFLKKEDLNKYCYKNIIFRIDEEVNFEMSKRYKKMYF